MKKLFSVQNLRKLFVHEKNEKVRADIQALRALAVVVVVVYHLAPSRLEGGFVGVDIFFVISGFLMTTTIMKMINRRKIIRKKNRGTVERWENTKLLFEFYAKRILRLAPAAVVTLIVILGVVKVSGLYDLQIKTSEQVITSALFVENWKLVEIGTDYLRSSEQPTAVQHFWSLSVEEQFYAIWPLFLIFVAAVSLFVVRKVKPTRLKLIKKYTPLILLSLFTIGSFLYSLWLTRNNTAAAYFVTPARLWELSLGGGVALIPALKDRDLRLLLPWFGLSLCLFSVWWISGDAPFPGWIALLPTIGTALIIYGAGDTKWSVNNLSRFRPFQWLGNISYSLYLWHWPLIVLVPLIFDVGVTNIKTKIIVLVASLVMAQLSYKFIETPFRKIRMRK